MPWTGLGRTIGQLCVAETLSVSKLRFVSQKNAVQLGTGSSDLVGAKCQGRRIDRLEPIQSEAGRRKAELVSVWSRKDVVCSFDSFPEAVQGLTQVSLEIKAVEMQTGSWQWIEKVVVGVVNWFWQSTVVE